jgi:GntR family transcriptional regulator, transcriptional repressor for pyruvate dehydrogenase complex
VALTTQVRLEAPTLTRVGEQAPRVPAYQQLADDLRARIASGRLSPGDRLPTEPKLCASYRVSRSTVREALRLLASQHLIVTTRGVNGGSFVSQPSAAQLADTLSVGVSALFASGTFRGEQLFEARELIEVPSAGLAAARRDEADLADLRAALVDPETADFAAVRAARRSFHAALVTASGNPLLEIVSRPLYDVANESALAKLAPPGFWADVDDEHRAIVEAIARRDVDAARAAAAEHLAHLRRLYASEPIRIDDR